jgi:hypothetical protein
MLRCRLVKEIIVRREGGRNWLRIISIEGWPSGSVTVVLVHLVGS